MIILGTIPADIGYLTNLDYLDVDTNLLTGFIMLMCVFNVIYKMTFVTFSVVIHIGTIPTSIGKLSLLQYAFLENNSLNGMC